MRFINSISSLPEHHGKFLVHCLDPKSFKNEELRLYRFADFIKYIRKDLNDYENFSLLSNNLYTLQLFIHTPENEKYEKNINQHSTTMSILYRIIGGINHVSKIKNGEKIHVYIYDNTLKEKCNDVINEQTSQIINYNTSLNLFKFNNNEIIRVLEKVDNKYILKIVKSNHIPWFNFSTNSITPTDKWKIPQSITSTMHHSISYIANNKSYYKFPDDKSNHHISFNIYIHDNLLYHKCVTSIEDLLNFEHNDSKCYISKFISESPNIVEDIDFMPRTINHYYLSHEMENKNDPKLKELQKICNIQKTKRLNFIKNKKSLLLIKYIEDNVLNIY